MRSSDGRPGPDLPDRLGQAPVDDQGLAILADDDVGRLDVAVDHAAGVGVLDGVADVDEPTQERPQGERAPAGVVFHHRIGVEGGDGVLEGVAADEPHGVVGTATAIAAEAVDRHDPRMFEASGDLGFEDEPGAAGGIIGVAVEDLLERDLAIQLGVERDEDGAQSSARMGPQDPEPLPVGRGGAE